MKQKGFLLGLIILSAVSLLGASSKYKVVGGPDDFYFGHISYVEIKNDGKDPLVFREGQQSGELAVLNLPLGPDDVIQTSDSRRCEVQFDNGTIVRLDFRTNLKIETILADSLSTARKMSNLLLARGRIYVMYKKYSSLEIFQVITPHAAVKLDQHAVALIGVSEERDTDLQVERGKAYLLYGYDKFHISQKKVKAKERYLVTGDDEIQGAEYSVGSDFKAWNESVNRDFEALHEDHVLPKPVQNLPPAVFYFAQNYGNKYGEWLWHDYYGYVWRPFYNDYYPWGDWAPYIYGNWSSYQKQLFWIPGEPWGWVPYHLGIWMWDKNKGWVWLPGSFFAPAWAVWDFYGGFYTWRPWSLFDWYYSPDYFWDLSGGLYWDYDPGAVLPAPGSVPIREILTTVRKNQLQKKSPQSPMSKELKKAYQTTVAALKRGDENAVASLRAIPRQAVFLKKGEGGFSMRQEKIIGVEGLRRQLGEKPAAPNPGAARPSTDVSREVLRSIGRSRGIAEAEARMRLAREEPAEASPEPGGHLRLAPARMSPVERQESERLRSLRRIEDRLAPTGQDAVVPSPSLRFRDWNPDVRAAVRLGVDITYDSRRNEIAAPQLGLRSGDLGMRQRMSIDGPRSLSAPSGSADAPEAGPASPGRTASPGGVHQKESSGKSGDARKN
jgi:hypothetical protein